MNTPTPKIPSSTTTPTTTRDVVNGERASPGSKSKAALLHDPSDRKGRIADALHCIVDSMDVIVREAPRGAQAQFSSAKEKLLKAREAITAYTDASKSDERGAQRMENEGSSTGPSKATPRL